MYMLSRVRLSVTPWTVAHQAPLSMGFPRQEYWSGLPFPSPGDLHNPGIKPLYLTSPALTGGSFTTSTKKRVNYMTSKILLDSETPLTYNCLAHREHIHTGFTGGEIIPTYKLKVARPSPRPPFVSPPKCQA